MKFFKNLNSRNTFIILCIVGAIALTVTVGQKYKFTAVENGIQYVVVPVKKGLSLIGNGLDNITLRFNKVSKLEEENNELEKKMGQLLYHNNILEQHEKENQRLKQLLDIMERNVQYPSEGANVIAKEPGNWYKIFIIDKGTKDDITKNDVILADGGLVGHVVEAGPLSSKILSIIDDRSSVSAKVLRTGDVGILKGDIELVQQGLCRLQIDIHSEVIKGDQIVTSHLSTIYPPGITIGIVEDIVIAKNGLNQHVYVRPIVDFKHLEQILILHLNNDLD